MSFETYPSEWKQIQNLKGEIRDMQQNHITALQNAISQGFNVGYKAGIEQKTKWIPCSEQVPMVSDEYLITWTCEWNGKLMRSISIAEYDAEAEEWNTDAYIRNYSREVGIIAWMPLPEPYKEAENGFYT